MSVIHTRGLEGATSATGTAVVIDTFRAFTTAAYAQAKGAGTHYLTSTVDEAREIARRNPGAVLCGEVDGVKPDGFDLGNSPAEVLRTNVDGRAFIQRTSGGTRCAMAALSSGAADVFAASLVVAAATARAICEAPTVTMIASGRGAVVPVFEDDATARLIDAMVNGTGEPVRVADEVRRSTSASRLINSSWADPDDVALATEVDRFDFAMRCRLHPDGTATLSRTGPT